MFEDGGIGKLPTFSGSRHVARCVVILLLRSPGGRKLQEVETKQVPHFVQKTQ